MIIGQNGSASLVEYGGKKDSNLLIKKSILKNFCNLHYFAKLQDLAQTGWIEQVVSYIFKINIKNSNIQINILVWFCTSKIEAQ